MYPLHVWFCYQCGQSNNLESKYCANCGTALPPQPEPSEVQRFKAKKSSSALIIVVSIVGLTLFLAICGFVLVWQDSKKTNPQQASLIPATPSPVITPPPLTPENLRVRLETTYKGTMERTHPHLNYIKTNVVKTKGGYALFARHEYFGQYTLSIGGTARVIEDWINANQEDLKKAGIVRVGVQSSDGIGGSSYFDIK